jgi:endonuclease-3
MNYNEIRELIGTLREFIKQFKEPIVTEVARKRRSPFTILVATLISLRTKDDVTREASRRLFALADTPEKMIQLPIPSIEKAIYPTGFYRTKAQRIHDICETLIREYNGQVPDSINALMKLKGVGRKTANLVVTQGFGKLGICVDTHVHRISNRLGLVKTKTPDKTEMALRKILPKEFWIEYNDLLVTFGQNLCTPISPFCSRCPVPHLCQKIGVKIFR